MSLDSIVYALVSGQSAESIAHSFPVLTFEQVCGAIAFHLGHRDEVDRYLEAQRQDFEARRAAAAPGIRCSTRSPVADEHPPDC